MAEPAGTSPPAAGGAERDALLATKLHLPPPRLPVPPAAAGAPGGGRDPGADAGLRPRRVRQDQPAGRLAPPRPARGRLAVAGRGRQRSSEVLAGWGRRARPGGGGG